MSEREWQRRLKDAIERDGRSYLRISEDAGLGRNHVQQFMRYGKLPSAEAVLRLCNTLRLSITYVFTGARMSPAAEEVLTRFSALSEEQQERFLEFLRSLQRDDEAPE